MRLYKSMRPATRSTLKTSLPVKNAVLTDMLEENSVALACTNASVILEFHPFEIKTVVFTL